MFSRRCRHLVRNPYSYRQAGALTGQVGMGEAHLAMGFALARSFSWPGCRKEKPAAESRRLEDPTRQRGHESPSLADGRALFLLPSQTTCPGCHPRVRLPRRLPSSAPVPPGADVWRQREGRWAPFHRRPFPLDPAPTRPSFITVSLLSFRLHRGTPRQVARPHAPGTSISGLTRRYRRPDFRCEQSSYSPWSPG